MDRTVERLRREYPWRGGEGISSDLLWGEYPRMVRRLLRLWKMATPEELEHGRRWYHDARAAIFGIADMTGHDPVALTHAVAALSVNCSWERNIGAAMLAADQGIDAYPIMVGTIGKARRKAFQILEENDYTIHDLMPTGGKVQSFAWVLLLLENFNGAVSDSHMIRAMLDLRLQDCAPFMKPGKYRIFAAAIKAAARAVGVETHVFQATVWLVVKRLRNEVVPDQFRDSLFGE